MSTKQPPLKVFIDASEVKDKTECGHCLPGAYLRFFRINPETEIYKCEKGTCMFPFQKFIYRDTPSQKLYRIGTHPVAERYSFAELSADLDSYINKYNEEGIPDNPGGGDIIEDLFPEAWNETTQPLRVEIDLPATSSPLNGQIPLFSPTNSFARVNLVASMLQNLEGKYKCKSCESKSLVKYLKFHQINDTTELFKCESSNCMFPFRNFIYRDRTDRSYFRFKPISYAESSTTYSQTHCSSPNPPPQLADVHYDFKPNPNHFDIKPNLTHQEPSVSEKKIPQPSHSGPKVIESIVLSPRNSIGRIFSIKKKRKANIPSEDSVPERKIPTPLELIRNLLKRNQPIEESVALESFKQSRSKRRTNPAILGHQKRGQRTKKTGVFPTSSQPVELPQLDEDDHLLSAEDTEAINVSSTDISGSAKHTIVECATLLTTARRSCRVRSPKKIVLQISEDFQPSKPRTRSMTEKSVDAEKSDSSPSPRKSVKDPSKASSNRKIKVRPRIKPEEEETTKLKPGDEAKLQEEKCIDIGQSSKVAEAKEKIQMNLPSPNRRKRKPSKALGTEEIFKGETPKVSENTKTVLKNQPSNKRKRTHSRILETGDIMIGQTSKAVKIQKNTQKNQPPNGSKRKRSTKLETEEKSTITEPVKKRTRKPR